MGVAVSFCVRKKECGQVQMDRRRENKGSTQESFCVKHLVAKERRDSYVQTMGVNKIRVMIVKRKRA